MQQKNATVLIGATIIMIIIGGYVACKHVGPASGGSAPQLDPMPIVMVALGSGAQLATTSGELAEERGDFVGCVVGHSLGSALQSGRDGLAGNFMGAAIPGIQLDLSGCLAIQDEELEGEEIPDIVGPLVDVALGGTLTIIEGYEEQFECRDRVWAMAAITYAQSALPAILDEVETPDGVIQIPQVIVPIADCGADSTPDDSNE